MMTGTLSNGEVGCLYMNNPGLTNIWIHSHSVFHELKDKKFSCNRKLLLPTMARDIHGIVVQNHTGLLESDHKKPMKAFGNDEALGGAKGLLLS